MTESAVAVNVDAQGSGLGEDETDVYPNARVECRVFVSERMLVGLRWHAHAGFTTHSSRIFPLAFSLQASLAPL